MRLLWRASKGFRRAIPGVTHAEVTAAMPYSDTAWVRDFTMENFIPVMHGSSRQH